MIQKSLETVVWLARPGRFFSGTTDWQQAAAALPPALYELQLDKTCWLALNFQPAEKHKQKPKRISLTFGYKLWNSAYPGCPARLGSKATLNMHMSDIQEALNDFEVIEGLIINHDRVSKYLWNVGKDLQTTQRNY
jgi:hypothetical protein